MTDLPDEVREELHTAADRGGPGFGPAVLHTVMTGWARMLGIVSVEVTGHLAGAMGASEAFVVDQLDRLLDDLLVAGARSLA